MTEESVAAFTWSSLVIWPRRHQPAGLFSENNTVESLAVSSWLFFVVFFFLQNKRDRCEISRKYNFNFPVFPPNDAERIKSGKIWQDQIWRELCFACLFAVSDGRYIFVSS